MFKLPEGCHVGRAIEWHCKVWYRKCRYDLKQKAYNDCATVADRRANPSKELIQNNGNGSSIIGIVRSSG